MEYLLTGGVLAFQIVILVTIIGAASTGRGSLFLTTAVWVVFTLFGSIFTAGLMLLQLITIFIAYSFGSSVAKEKIPESRSLQKKSDDSSWGVIIIVVVLISVFLNRESSKKPEVSSPVTNFTQPVEQVNSPPKPKPKLSDNHSNSRRVGVTRKNKVNSPTAKCFDLTTDTETLQCLNYEGTS